MTGLGVRDGERARIHGGAPAGAGRVGRRGGRALAARLGRLRRARHRLRARRLVHPPQRAVRGRVGIGAGPPSRPPGPDAAVVYAVVFGWVGQHPLVVLCVQAVIGVATAVALVHLLRRFFPPGLALVATLLWVLLPNHTSLEVWASATNIALCVLLTVVATDLLCARDRRVQWAAVPLFAAAGLCYEAVLPLAAVAILVVPWVRRGRPDWRLVGGRSGGPRRRGCLDRDALATGQAGVEELGRPRPDDRRPLRLGHRPGRTDRLDRHAGGPHRHRGRGGAGGAAVVPVPGRTGGVGGGDRTGRDGARHGPVRPLPLRPAGGRRPVQLRVLDRRGAGLGRHPHPAVGLATPAGGGVGGACSPERPGSPGCSVR